MSAGDPWWYSGTPSGPEPEGASDQPARGGFSLSALVTGAQQIVDLAKQAILVPHADHDDPSEHGECLVCRGLVALDEVRGWPSAGNVNGPDSRSAAGPVRWIDLDPGQRDT